MGIEIDSLPLAISLDGSEIVPIVQGGTTKRTTTEAIAASQAAVTSINISGGTTGLTVSGGPITTSGTMTIGGQIALATNVSGTLPVANGGTGATTLTSSGVLLGQGTSAVGATAALTNGQLLVGQTGADPLPKTISGDTTVAASGAVTVVSASTTFALSGVISATISADQNDWAPTGVGSATTIRVDGGAASRNITGIAGGATGRIITIHNIGSPNNLVLVNDSASSSASNRLAIASDATLLPNQSVTLEYDATSSRWRSFASTITPGGAAAGTVISVAVSGGTTGLSTSGGPITTTGTITLAGTLAVANGGTGITSLGSGIATWLGTPSSANLASAITDETGSGALVFGTSPGFTTAANPVSSDGAALGTTALMWSDLFLASGGVINFNNGDVTITHSANVLGFAGASSGYTFDADATIHGATVGLGAGAVASNTAIGVSSLYSNTTGAYNTASGYQALYANTTGASNTASGHQALFSNTTGASNTAIGLSALHSNTTGAANTASGYQALFANTTGAENTASGYLSLYSNTTGAANTAIGVSSLYSNTTGAYNTASGYQALFSNTTGASNTASGVNSLYANTTGAANTASGYQALFANTTGAENTASGYLSLYSNTTGAANTAIGVSSLYSNTTGAYNTASGYQALYANTTGAYNTAIGLNSLYSNTTGAYNTASGYQALYANTTGAYNTAIGLNSLYSNTTGAANTAIGVSSLYSNTTGAYNTAIGLNSGYGNGTNANTTGTNNTFIGYEAVGTSASASNVVTLGNASIATLRCAVTTITAISDRRDKTDIEQMPLGENFVNALNPVRYTWDMRDKSKIGVPDSGFIAQDLQDVSRHFDAGWLGLVYEENPDRLEASPGRLLPVMVKAIQELSAKVAALERRIGEH